MKNLNTLPADVQAEVKKTLKAFDKVNVYFANGEYHVSTATFLLSEYPEDFEVIGRYHKDEVFTLEEQIINYMESFHEYHPSYKGMRDYKMLQDLANEKSFIDCNGNEHTYPNWDVKFKFDVNGNIVRA